MRMACHLFSSYLFKWLDRFHVLAEFDEAKRSCRKRLADHNRRRRKPQLPTTTTTESSPSENTTTNSSEKATTDTRKFRSSCSCNSLSHLGRLSSSHAFTTILKQQPWRPQQEQCAPRSINSIRTRETCSGMDQLYLLQALQWPRKRSYISSSSSSRPPPLQHSTTTRTTTTAASTTTTSSAPVLMSPSRPPEGGQAKAFPITTRATSSTTARLPLRWTTCDRCVGYGWIMHAWRAH